MSHLDVYLSILWHFLDIYLSKKILNGRKRKQALLPKKPKKTCEIPQKRIHLFCYMDTKIEITDISTVKTAANAFIRQMGNNKVFAFHGAMGAGKTTFIKAICEELGVKETVSSPTFAIINEYHAENGNTIYHFDFYRIEKIEEALDFGCEEYLYSGNLCFIEWAERIEALLPEDIVNVYIHETENGTRKITLR